MADDFPKIKRAVSNFIADEEGNISRGKLLRIGTFMILMGLIFNIDALAAHSSHSSHGSHSSTSYTRSPSSHYSHGSHASHASHESHSSSVGHVSHASSTVADQASTNWSSSYGLPGRGEVSALMTPEPTSGLGTLPDVAAVNAGLHNAAAAVQPSSSTPDATSSSSVSPFPRKISNIK